MLGGAYAAANLPSWQGANRSDTRRYREDSQRRHGGKGAAHKCWTVRNTALVIAVVIVRRVRSAAFDEGRHADAACTRLPGRQPGRAVQQRIGVLAMVGVQADAGADRDRGVLATPG